MKVYISGPITGIPHYEINFMKAEKFLKGNGHIVINPVRIGKYLQMELKREPTYEEYLERDIQNLRECDAIVYLPGWQNSNGCKKEKEIADALKLNVIKYYVVD